MLPIVVCGIDTEVGKTIVCSILATALQAEYWKPLQTGEDSDTKRVLSLTHCHCHPEGAVLSALHAGGSSIEIPQLPKTRRRLVIEGSGGVMSPFNHSLTQLDLFHKWKALRVLVVKHYLGCINHTLLSIEAFCPLGLIFNGPADPLNEKFILKYSGLPSLGRIPHLPQINRSTIQCQAKRLKPLWKKIANTSGILTQTQLKIPSSLHEEKERLSLQIKEKSF